MLNSYLKKLIQPVRQLSKIIWLRRLLLVSWLIALFLFSHRAHVNQEPGIPHLDKLKHFIFFSFGGGVFFLNYARNSKLLSLKSLALLIILVIIGALDEYHQSFIPGRSGNDIFDWLANCVGAVSGAILLHQLRRARKKQAKYDST